MLLSCSETIIEQIASEKGQKLKRIDDDEDDKNIFDTSDEFDDDLGSISSDHASSQKQANTSQKPSQALPLSSSTPACAPADSYNPFSDSIHSPNDADANMSFPRKALVAKTDSVSSRSDSGYGDNRSQMSDSMTPAREGQRSVEMRHSDQTAKSSPHRKKKGDVKKCVCMQ